MPKSQKTLAPQQARSRESLNKLLKAAQEVLGQHGLAGSTIPRIAHHAGLTPGAVYRRFPDKEALLETVILGLLKRQDERIRVAMTADMVRQIPLPVFAEQMIHNMVLSYRTNAGLLRAMRQFSQSRMHTPFAKKASRLETSTYQHLINLFLVHGEEIRHPEPQMAVSLALTMLFSTLTELALTEAHLSNWLAMMPKNDASLKRELTRAFLSYLGVEQKRV